MSKCHIIAEPNSPLITITNEFDAPRELVFRAYTDRELLPRWLGPRGLPLTVEEWNVHDGGKWRYVHHSDELGPFGFHGVFHGTPSPEAIVQTFEYEGAPGHVKLDTVTFEEHDGRTLVRTVSAFQSVEDRDAMVANGMERGIGDSDERLDEVLAELQSA